MENMKKIDNINKILTAMADLERGGIIYLETKTGDFVAIQKKKKYHFGNYQHQKCGLEYVDSELIPLNGFVDKSHGMRQKYDLTIDEDKWVKYNEYHDLHYTALAHGATLLTEPIGYKIKIMEASKHPYQK